MRDWTEFKRQIVEAADLVAAKTQDQFRARLDAAARSVDGLMLTVRQLATALLDTVRVSRKVATACFRVLQSALRLAASDRDCASCFVDVALKRDRDDVVLTVELRATGALRSVELLFLREKLAVVGGVLTTTIQADARRRSVMCF